MPYAKYVQLATVKTDGRPACRTVVFRGFYDEFAGGLADRPWHLTFVTDARSKKVDEVAQSPFAELCWYFPGTREQYRISGTLEIVSSAHPDPVLLKARVNAWKRMSDGGRAQFAWPQPGLPRLEEHEHLYKDAPPTDPEIPLEAFCLVILAPEEVDHLQLRENERQLHCMREGEWVRAQVNP